MILRFTNSVVRRLKESHSIDLMALSAEQMASPETRLIITQAGCTTETAERVESEVDDMTPGEHQTLLNDALMRDLIPAAYREATAKAADQSKSADAGT